MSNETCTAMGARRDTTGKLQIYEMSLVIHPKDHEPDWNHGVCCMCELGQVREVDTKDGTLSPSTEGG